MQLGARCSTNAISMHVQQARPLVRSEAAARAPAAMVTVYSRQIERHVYSYTSRIILPGFSFTHRWPMYMCTELLTVGTCRAALVKKRSEA